SANRILKYLEEPDQDTTAILLTDNGYGLLNTIKSRCQIIDLKPLDQLAFQHKDRKSTRLNSSHVSISYAVFCLKKKKMYKQCRTVIERNLSGLIIEREEQTLAVVYF